MDKVDDISVSELDEAENELIEALHLDLDYDDDFDEVEDMRSPLVSKWILPDDDGPTYGLVVPVMKDDDSITDEVYNVDIKIDPTGIPCVCSICLNHWNVLHPYCCLPCGHIFGFTCIQKWLQTNSSKACPMCNALCSLEDIRHLHVTPFRFPAADKGVKDPKISTRRFAYTRTGAMQLLNFEAGQLNLARIKRAELNERIVDIGGRYNDLMKRQNDLLDRRASVLNRAKALEKQGGSADALRLHADALGKWVDVYLQRAEAYERRAKALIQKSQAYYMRIDKINERMNTFKLSGPPSE